LEKVKKRRLQYNEKENLFLRGAARRRGRSQPGQRKKIRRRDILDKTGTSAQKTVVKRRGKPHLRGGGGRATADQLNQRKANGSKKMMSVCCSRRRRGKTAVLTQPVQKFKRKQNGLGKKHAKKRGIGGGEGEVISCFTSRMIR